MGGGIVLNLHIECHMGPCQAKTGYELLNWHRCSWDRKYSVCGGCSPLCWWKIASLIRQRCDARLAQLIMINHIEKMKNCSVAGKCSSNCTNVEGTRREVHKCKHQLTVCQSVQAWSYPGTRTRNCWVCVLKNKNRSVICMWGIQVCRTETAKSHIICYQVGMYIQRGGMVSVFAADCHLAKLFQRTLRRNLLLITDVIALCRMNIYILIQIGSTDETPMYFSMQSNYTVSVKKYSVMNETLGYVKLQLTVCWQC